MGKLVVVVMKDGEWLYRINNGLLDCKTQKVEMWDVAMAIRMGEGEGEGEGGQ